MNMKVNIAGVEWNNPVTVASGTSVVYQLVDRQSSGNRAWTGAAYCVVFGKSAEFF